MLCFPNRDWQIRQIQAWSDASPYLGFVGHALRPLLHDLAPLPQAPWISAAGRCLAWGVAAGRAFHDPTASGEPAGLLVAVLEDQAGQAPSPGSPPLRLAIVSLHIKKPWRRHGLATALVEAALSWAAGQGLASLVIRFGTEPLSYSRQGLLKIFRAEHGWQEIEREFVFLLSNPAKVGAVLHRMEHISLRLQRRWGWRVAPYPASVTPAMHKRLGVRVANAYSMAWLWNPEESSPTWRPAREYSRLLLYDEEVIGWLIAERIHRDRLHYSQLWVDPGWEESGGFLGLLCSAMRAAHFEDEQFPGRQPQRCSPIPTGSFMVRRSNRPMMRAIARRFEPAADSVVSLKTMLRPLASQVGS